MHKGKEQGGNTWKQTCWIQIRKCNSCIAVLAQSEKNILLPSPQSHPQQTGVCTQQVYKPGPFISLFSRSCLSTALLEPRGAPAQMPLGLGTGWAPEPGPASSQHQEIHRERVAGLLGLSEGQQKGGSTRTGDGARSCTQTSMEHCQTEERLRIDTWAIPEEEV